jgi:hypothetical protein
VTESSDTDQASVVFLGRESFRMQVVGAPAAATNVGAIPSRTWETPTERIFERRKAPRVLQPVPGWATGSSPAPTLTKTTIVGVGFITFACGVLVATAVDRLRPHFGSPDRIAQVERMPATTATVQLPPAAATPKAPAEPPAPAAPIVQPMAKGQLEPLLAAQPLAPEPAAEMPKAEAVPAAKGTPAPRVRVAPASMRPRRPAQPPAIKTTEPLWEQPAAAKAAVTPPSPGKWVDPFAD